MKFGHYHTKRGLSLVEVVVIAAITLLMFGGLFAGLQTMISLIGNSKAEAGARSLAVERLEYIRSLAYNDIGTVSGIPSGDIPQTRTQVLNGITYTERVLVEYVDDDDDGEGVDDENGILADYKRIKIEYTWDRKGTTKELSLITNIVPPGIETTDGGGTITVNVFDASVSAIENAAVTIYNDSGTSTIDITKYTNSSGVAQFSGAPALSNYEISVTKTGYSTDSTYNASSTNPNPSPSSISVLESAVSTMSFQIDELSDLTINTVGEPVTDTISDTFDDSSGINTLNNTVVSGGAVILDSLAGAYLSSGTVLGNAVTPGSFDRWDNATFTATTSADTDVVMQVYEVTATSTNLLSDAVVSGNSVGFTSGTVIDLSGLDSASYASLALQATLTTSDASSTPELTDWEISYVEDEPPITGVSFTMTSNKTIGTNASSSPVYKYEKTHVTDSNGESSLTDLEWDVYDITLNTSSYDIAEACEPIPYVLDPGVTETLKLTLVTAVTNSLRVRVEDNNGAAIAGADVTLSRTGFSESDTTSTCGQTFFNNGVSSATDYQVDVSASGYTNVSESGVTIDGATTLTVVMTP